MFLGQDQANPEESCRVFPERLRLSAPRWLASSFPQEATLQTLHSGYQQTHQVNPQSSEELALVCLQVLADLRNVQDNYYRTQKRPTQPSHIWKEGSGHTKESERDLLLPLNSQTKRRLEPPALPSL